MAFGLRRAKALGYLSVQVVSKIFNLGDPDPPTSQTDWRTDGRTTCNLNTALWTSASRYARCTSASRGKSQPHFHVNYGTARATGANEADQGSCFAL